MVKNPAPNNIDSIENLDEVLKSILRDKHQTSKINLDNILEKTQRKVCGITDPLSKIWKIIEIAKENQVMISMEDLLTLAEKGIVFSWSVQ